MKDKKIDLKDVVQDMKSYGKDLTYTGNDFQALLKFLPSLNGRNEDDVRTRIGGESYTDYLKKKCQYLGKTYTLAIDKKL